MKKKILIIDDDIHWIEILSARLKARGYEIAVAENGEQGFDAMTTGKPDLVIADVLMPHMTGYELLNKLEASSGRVRDIPIIVVSSRGSMEEYFDSWKIHRFIPKAADMDVLVGEVDHLLSRGGADEAPAKALFPDELLPWAGKKVMLVGMDDYIVGKVKMFLEQQSIKVVVGLNEQDAFETAVKERPQFIFCQFYEDTEKLDADALNRQLKKDDRTKAIPFVPFCTEAISIDAMKSVGARYLITFGTGSELAQNIANFLKAHPDFSV